MKELYGQFVKQGDLVFNVGANVGTRTAVFLELGATVVAVEPQAQLCDYLRDRFASEDVEVVCAAAGPEVGKAKLHLCSDSQLATCAKGWADSLKGHWPAERWDKTITVPQTTLDALIETYGLPDFIKIDVEGYEDQVLKGLSQPMKALSFEFTVPYLAPALESLKVLERLGYGRFNYIEQEVMRFKATEWISGRMMAGILEHLPVSTFYGDVFARQEATMKDEEKAPEEKKAKKIDRSKVPIKDGMIVGADGLGIWCIDEGKRRVVPDVVTQLKMGIGMHHVVMLPPAELEEIPEGEPMPKIPLRRVGGSGR
jgi:FkbM family methyltransferase